MAVTSAIVLAGGLGTRLREAVPDLPKPMAPINGRPFLEILMDYWIGQGIRRFVLSLGYRHEVFQSHFGAAYRGSEVLYAVETRPLGTGGALLHATRMLQAAEPFLALNGDTFFEIGLAVLSAFHTSKRAEITLSLKSAAAENVRGTLVETDETQRVTAFQNEDGNGRRLINGGVYLLAAEALTDLPHPVGRAISLEDDLLTNALRGGKRLYGYPGHGRFIDIGAPERYARAAITLNE